MYSYDYRIASLSDLAIVENLRKLFKGYKPEELSKHLKDPEFALLHGTLGSVEKGGRAIEVDEGQQSQATRLLNVMSGKETGELDDKFFKDLSSLVQLFIVPKKGK